MTSHKRAISSCTEDNEFEQREDFFPYELYEPHKFFAPKLEASLIFAIIRAQDMSNALLGLDSLVDVAMDHSLRETGAPMLLN